MREIFGVLELRRVAILAFAYSGLSLEAATVGLADFVQSGSLTAVGSPVSENLSGVAYNADSDTLFAVINGPERLVELGRDGTVIRAIDLSGFDDTEGIISLGGNRFGVTEERGRNFVTFTLGEGDGPISYSAATTKIIPLGSPGTAATPSQNEGNLGIEGVAYDAANGAVYVAWEKSNNPGVTEQEVRSFDLANAEAAPGVTPVMVDPFADGVLASLGLSDIAGLHFVSTTSTLLILGEEDEEVVELGLDGVQRAGILDLSDFGQPEGITRASDGTIFVVGEPDEFGVFTNPVTTVPEPNVIALILFGSGLVLRRRRVSATR